MTGGILRAEREHHALVAIALQGRCLLPTGQPTDPPFLLTGPRSFLSRAFRSMSSAKFLCRIRLCYRTVLAAERAFLHDSGRRATQAGVWKCFLNTTRRNLSMDPREATPAPNDMPQMVPMR